METLAFDFCVLMIVLGIIMLVIICYNPWYCRFFHHNEWNAWEEILPQLKNVVLIGYDESKDTHAFTLNNNHVYLIEGCKVGIVCNDGTVLTWFDIYHNKKAVEILKTMI